MSEFQRLDRVDVPTVNTAAAAHYLNRQPQTLRAWACLGGPIIPVRINGRLAWKVKEIKALLNGEAIDEIEKQARAQKKQAACPRCESTDYTRHTVMGMRNEQAICESCGQTWWLDCE